MKKLLQKFGLFLLGKKHVYTHSHEGRETIIVSDRELSEHARYGINQELKHDDASFLKKLNLNQVLLETLNEHKGTIEDGKCFLASEQFILGVGKDGKVKPIVDCNTPAKTK
jgi:hypothetical protein